jgi:hypothetical protein
MLFPLLLSAAAAAQTLAEKPFPEPTPVLIEACLKEAIEQRYVSKTKDSWKYMCAGASADALWDHLVALDLGSWEQVQPGGTWLSRSFPLGACFRRVKDPDGQAVDTGLSCTVWIPRK